MWLDEPRKMVPLGELTEGAEYNKRKSVSNDPFQDGTNDLKHSTEDVISPNRSGTTATSALPAHQGSRQRSCSNNQPDDRSADAQSQLMTTGMEGQKGALTTE